MRLSHSCPPHESQRHLSQGCPILASYLTAVPFWSEDTAPPPPMGGLLALGCCSWLRESQCQVKLLSRLPQPLTPPCPSEVLIQQPLVPTHLPLTFLWGVLVALSGHSLWEVIYTSWGGVRTECPAPAPSPAVGTRPPPSPRLHGSWQLLQPVLPMAACAPSHQDPDSSGASRDLCPTLSPVCRGLGFSHTQPAL